MPGVRMRGGLRPRPSHTDTSGRRSHPYTRSQHSAPDQSQTPPLPPPAAATSLSSASRTTPQLLQRTGGYTSSSDTEPWSGGPSAGAALPPALAPPPPSPTSTWTAADADTDSDSDSDAEGLMVRHLAASLRRPVPWQRHQPRQPQDADNRGPLHTFNGDWYGPVRRNSRVCRLCRRRAVDAHVLFGALFDAVAREPSLIAIVRQLTRARVQRTMLLSSTTTTGSGGSSMAARGGADGGGAHQRPRIIAPVPRRCAAAWPPVLIAAEAADAAQDDDDDEAAQPLSPSAIGARLHRPRPYHSHHLLLHSSESDSSH